jgi:plastocyanin
MTIATARASSWRIAAVAVTLTLLALGMRARVGGAAVGPRAAKTHTVTIEATSFQPDRLTVAEGDAVVWVNKDPFPHTATSAGVFDSASIAPEKSWKFVAAKKGSFDYICTFHPTMKARLTVE